MLSDSREPSLCVTDGTNTTQYTYNGIGNMTAVTKNGEQIKSYTYDNFERLISSTVNGTTTSYAYDGDNLRQTKTTDGITTAHIYDGMNVVADTVGADTTLFIRGNGLVYSKNLTTNERITYNTHSKGDVAQLVKPDGTFTEYTYSAYGRIHYNTTDNTNPFTYCGEYTDIETGLVYLRNRYYDPSIGRFITEDPIRDGLNWHMYCNGDPVNCVDPLGLVITDWDREKCSSSDLKQLKANDEIWRNGNQYEKEQAAQSSRNIRLKYIASNEKLLDNGFVEKEETLTYNVSNSASTIYANTMIKYTTLYTDNGTYLNLTNVSIDVSVNSGHKLKTLEISIGCVGLDNTSQKNIFVTDKKHFEYSPKYTMVKSDLGNGYTIVGAYFNIEIERGSSHKYLQICNQVYDRFIDDNGIYSQPEYDEFGFYREGMQRSERKQGR